MKKKILCLLLSMFLLIPMTSVGAASIKISHKKINIDIFHSKKLKVKGTKKKIKWSSSNKKVATVSKKGNVISKKVGKATITAKIGKKKLRCKVTVTNNRGSYLKKYYSDRGESELTINTKKIRYKKNKDFHIYYEIFELDRELETYVYLDRKLIDSYYVWGSQDFIELKGNALSKGKHRIAFVQYKDDNPNKQPVDFKNASYYVKR